MANESSRSFKTVPNIRYLGQVPPDRAIGIIGNAALLLSTSDGEGFPSVFLEAWANGTPVVSLSIDPDRLIARKSSVRCLANREVAAEDISALMESPGKRQDMADRGREYVGQFHTGAAAVAVVERALASRQAPTLQAFESVGQP